MVQLEALVDHLAAMLAHPLLLLRLAEVLIVFYRLVAWVRIQSGG